MRPSNYDLQAQAAGHSFAAQDLDAIAARFALRRDETSIWSFCMSRCAFPARTARPSGCMAACGCLRPSARP